MSERNVVGRVGINSGGLLSEKQTIIFDFHDYGSLSTERSQTSPPLMAHGHSWAVRIYPGGHSSAEEGYASVYLCHECGETACQEATVDFEIRIDQILGRHQILGRRDSHTFCAGLRLFGWHNFIKQEDIERQYLNNGTLTVEVDIQVYQNNPNLEYAVQAASMHSKSLLGNDIISLLDSGKYADVMFVIGEVKFPAHRTILASRAPTLADLAEGHEEEIPLDGVEAADFSAMLRFIYADTIPSNLSEKARTFLEVANRYGCWRLKLLAESELVKAGITVNNAADLILFADAQSCALLKEFAMDFFAVNAPAVIKSEGWSNLKESNSLLCELMETLAQPKSNELTDDIERMPVATLRRKLDENGLSVDGSREMLVKRLKTTPTDEH